MSIHPFELRAVAYLDILGFEALVRDAENSPSRIPDLLGLISVVGAHVLFDNATLDPNIPITAHPKYLFVSDTVIISTPFESQHYDGLDALVVKTTQIALKVMAMGYLVRGVINVGDVWHSGSNIFGSGYMDAAGIEKKVNTPRVLLTHQAAVHWKSKNRFAPNMCIEDGADQIVDLLNENYIRERNLANGVASYFQALRIRITDALNDLPQGERPWHKWFWMATFFNSALSRHKVSSISAIDLHQFKNETCS